MRHMIRRTLVIAASLVCALSAGEEGQAGTLSVYEGTARPGRPRQFVGAVINAPVDVDYSPASAEGGKLYGISEFEIEATGNLVLSPTGFACQAVACLFSPSPFVGGKKIRFTAGNDLVGETASAANLLTMGVTGSSGYVVLTRGEYLDATGSASSVGSVRTPDVTILVSVPEAELASGLAAACALLALSFRQAGRRGQPATAA